MTTALIISIALGSGLLGAFVMAVFCATSKQALFDIVDRQANAIGRLQAKRDKALAQVTPSANATVKRMAKILRGEG